MYKIIVIGGNFAGLTCALELKRQLGYNCKIVMISKLPYFIFTPSLIWIPFNKRKLEDIVIPLNHITEKAEINFICSEAIDILPEEKIVRCLNKGFSYDYLVIATGTKWDRTQIEGMGRQSNISYIFDIETTMKTRQSWKNFIKEPGPVVIGAAQGTQCIGPAYEFLFNFEKECRRNGIRNKVDITFITPEPCLGHLGMGGVIGSSFLFENLMHALRIKYITNTAIKKITNKALILNTTQSLPYKFSMIMPKFAGADVIKISGLGDENGFLPVNDGYQHTKYRNIFGVGSAANLPSMYPPVQDSIGVAKTGFAAIVSAKIAVRNIKRLINDYDQLKMKPITKLPELCVLAIGHKEIFTLAIPLLKPRLFSLALPDPVSEFGKIAVEKYFLWRFRRGYSKLPP